MTLRALYYSAVLSDQVIQLGFLYLFNLFLRKIHFQFLSDYFSVALRAEGLFARHLIDVATFLEAFYVDLVETIG